MNERIVYIVISEHQCNVKLKFITIRIKKKSIDVDILLAKSKARGKNNLPQNSYRGSGE